MRRSFSTAHPSRIHLNVPEAGIATQLGLRLVAGLEADPFRDLVDLLDEANNDLIRTFDLRRGKAPSTTVNIVRNSGHTLDVLVLCDSPVVVRGTDGLIRQVRDDRLKTSIAELRRPTTARDPQAQEWQAYWQSIESLRNSQDGFWCVSADRRSASEAVVSQLAITDVAIALAVSDGLSVGVDRYRTPPTWQEAVDIALSCPHNLVRKIHDTEQRDYNKKCWPRSKRFDDKTVAVVAADACFLDTINKT